MSKAIDRFLALNENQDMAGTADYYKKRLPKGVDRYMKEFIAAVHRRTGKPNFIVQEKYTVLTARSVYAHFVQIMRDERAKVAYDAEMELRAGKITSEEYKTYMAAALKDIAWSALWETYETKFKEFHLGTSKEVKAAVKRYAKKRKDAGFKTDEMRETCALVIGFSELAMTIKDPSKISKARMNDIMNLYSRLVSMEGLDEYVYLEDIEAANVYIHKFVALIKAFDKMLQKLRMTV